MLSKDQTHSYKKIVLNTKPDFFITQIQILTDRQKKINKQISISNIGVDWVYAFLIITVDKSYKNLNGNRPNQMLATMMLIFLVSLLLKIFLSEQRQNQKWPQADIKSLMLFLRQQVLIRQKLVLNYVLTFLSLLLVGCYYYLDNRFAAVYLLFVIAAPVSICMFAFCGIFLYKLNYQLKQLNLIITKIITSQVYP